LLALVGSIVIWSFTQNRHVEVLHWGLNKRSNLVIWHLVKDI